MKSIDVAIAIVYRAGQVLICQRRPDQSLPGLWEFPGGKLESGESLVDCLRRELREEVAIEASVIEPLPPIDYQYPDVRVRLHPFICEHSRGEPRPVACQAIRWVEPSDLRRYPFPPANAALIEALITGRPDPRPPVDFPPAAP